MISLPLGLLLVRIPFSSRGAGRPEKPTNTLAQPRVFLDPTPSLWSAPRVANSNVLVVVDHLVDTRSRMIAGLFGLFVLVAIH